MVPCVPSAAYVRNIQVIVAQGYNFARDIMVEFEKSNPTASEFSDRTWRRILADDRLDLDCWGTGDWSTVLRPAL